MEQRSGVFGGCAPASLDELNEQVIACHACERLVEWREAVARNKRAAFRDEEYWGKPVPGFGDPGAAIVVVGLAPAAHGANRTGRMFTGDRSGDWLYRAMHAAGLASQPTSTDGDDGLTLRNAYVTAPVRCAPPQNKPSPYEKAACSHWFDAELAFLTSARVYLVLGQIAYHSVWASLRRSGEVLPVPRPTFAHGAEVAVGDRTVVMSYHVSQQNTFTGRLTAEMLDRVMGRAVALAEG